jgi:hypothetical protein
MRSSGLACGLAIVFAWGCDFAVDDIEEVPENPTFSRDILPLFEDHCLLCHGNPPSRGAPKNFRLDVYEIVDSHHQSSELEERKQFHAGHDHPKGNGPWGAKDMALHSLQVVEEGLMPPAAKWGDGLGPNAKKMLRRWVEQGSPP